MKIQLIGKITGDPDYKEKFEAVHEALHNAGHEVWNPVEQVPQNMEYEAQMQLCLAALDGQDAICRISGWRDSEGAAREYAKAARLALAIVDAELVTLYRSELMQRNTYGVTIRYGKGC